MLPIDEDDDGNLIYEGGVEPIAIRTTERTNFKKCRRLHKYTSQNKLNLEPVRQNMNLVFGIAIHTGLEARYNPENWDIISDQAKTDISVAAFEQDFLIMRKSENELFPLSEERAQEYDEMLDLGIGMLRNYGRCGPREDQELGLKPLAVEYKFQVPVYIPFTDKPLVIDDRPVVYQVRIDMLAEHQATGDIWIWDHKTAANVSRDTSFLDLETQLSSYAWAYQLKFGQPIAGVMYNELAKSYPKPPKELKNGSLSQDKRQNTTYELYVEKLEELGLDPDPYGAMLEHLAVKGESHLRRTDIVKSQREISNIGTYVYQEILDMQTGATYPNPTEMNCRSCAFQTPCNVENEGGDVDFVLSDTSLFRSRSQIVDRTLDGKY